MQLDTRERGFSFKKEGPLDMRMDLSSNLTAKEVVNKWPEDRLGQLFREYGEEPQWKRAAKAIVQARHRKEIETTTELKEILTRAVKRSRKSLNPVTLCFQALRIAVNEELVSIGKGLKEAIRSLAPGGRIGVISFHRLEDRIVKNLFRAACKPLRKIVEMKESCFLPIMRLLNKKPWVPTFCERQENRRARSAKFRAAEKLVMPK